MKGVYPILEKVASIKGDIRYYLCGLHYKYHGIYSKKVDLSTESNCKVISETFIKILKLNQPQKSELSDILQNDKILKLPTQTRGITAPMESIDRLPSKVPHVATTQSQALQLRPFAPAF